MKRGAGKIIWPRSEKKSSHTNRSQENITQIEEPCNLYFFPAFSSYMIIKYTKTACSSFIAC